ncbi:lysine-specific demethylase 8-like [Sycon ciliatum]|uniref:lysine-specific demethylase 8-like n=1 Tax=Sycon ciliatum TaxID=27933 RepID=UPI0031F6D83C
MTTSLGRMSLHPIPVGVLLVVIVSLALLHSSVKCSSEESTASSDIDKMAADRSGHLKPLGSHRPPDGDVEILDYVPHPIDFYENYVKASKPVLLRGATKGSRAYKLWNDEYLTEKFGHLIVMTEHGKKENRSEGTSTIQLKTFVKRYMASDEYMVETLPPPMREDFQLLKCMLCGGFTKYLRDAVMWFSSGGTKSVFHYDNVENINCLMSGSKDLFLANKSYAELAHMIPGNAHSKVDVDSVDMDTFPGLGRIPWWRAHMEPGDCFYIPHKWFHQIRSYDRNLAINIWWVPVPQFHEDDCYVDGKLDGERKDLDDYSSLSNFGFTAGEASRNDMLERLKEQKSKKLSKDLLMEFIADSLGGEEDEEKAERLFQERAAAVAEMIEVGDVDKDDALDGPEVTSLPGSIIVKVFGSDVEEGAGPQDERVVRDYYAHENPEIEADELDSAEVELPEGFEFPEDFDPDTYDMTEYLRAVEEEKQRQSQSEAELDDIRSSDSKHTEL